MANIRITSVVQRPDGLLEVSGVLPDGAHVEHVVVESHDRTEIARALVTAEYHRPLPHLTGFAELSDDEYEKLRPYGHAKNADAVYRRQVALEAPAEEAADEKAESEGESSESSEGESAEGAEKTSRRARR